MKRLALPLLVSALSALCVMACAFFVLIGWEVGPIAVTFGTLGAVFVMLLVIGLWFTIDIWRDMAWESRERRGLCGRCGCDIRSSHDLCPHCRFPISINTNR